MNGMLPSFQPKERTMDLEYYDIVKKIGNVCYCADEACKGINSYISGMDCLEKLIDANTRADEFGVMLVHGLDKWGDHLHDPKTKYVFEYTPNCISIEEQENDPFYCLVDYDGTFTSYIQDIYNMARDKGHVRVLTEIEKILQNQKYNSHMVSLNRGYLVAKYKKKFIALACEAREELGQDVDLVLDIFKTIEDPFA